LRAGPALSVGSLVEVIGVSQAGAEPPAEPFYCDVIWCSRSDRPNSTGRNCSALTEEGKARRKSRPPATSGKAMKKAFDSVGSSGRGRLEDGDEDHRRKILTRFVKSTLLT